jgi:hypothetical protein
MDVTGYLSDRIDIGNKNIDIMRIIDRNVWNIDIIDDISNSGIIF